MARMHGSDQRVFLSTRDVSSDFHTADLEFTADLHPSDVFGINSHQFDAGLLGWSVSLDGFYSPGTTSIGPMLESMGSTAVISIFDGNSTAAGARGFVGAGLLETVSKPINVADLVGYKATIKGAARGGFNARLLHPLAAETGGGHVAEVDDTSSSLLGGRLNYHVTTVTGGGFQLVLQHSVDSTTWVDLITSSAIAGSTYATYETTATVQRYLTINIPTPSTAGSITFVAGFGRY